MKPYPKLKRARRRGRRLAGRRERNASRARQAPRHRPARTAASRLFGVADDEIRARGVAKIARFVTKHHIRPRFQRESRRHRLTRPEVLANQTGLPMPSRSARACGEDWGTSSPSRPRPLAPPVSAARFIAHEEAIELRAGCRFAESVETALSERLGGAHERTPRGPRECAADAHTTHA